MNETKGQEQNKRSCISMIAENLDRSKDIAGVALLWLLDRHVEKKGIACATGGVKMLDLEHPVFGTVSPDVHLLVPGQTGDDDRIVMITRKLAFTVETATRALFSARVLKVFAHESWVLFPSNSVKEAPADLREFVKAECAFHGIGLLAIPRKCKAISDAEEIVPAKLQQDGGAGIHDRDLVLDPARARGVAAAIRFVNDLQAAIEVHLQHGEARVQSVTISIDGAWTCFLQGPAGGRNYRLEITPTREATVFLLYDFFGPDSRSPSLPFSKQLPPGPGLIAGMVEYIASSIDSISKSEKLRGEFMRNLQF